MDPISTLTPGRFVALPLKNPDKDTRGMTPVKVVMIDSSLFTPQYDHYLCNALAEYECDVTLIGCPKPPSVRPLTPRRYAFVEWFYSRAHRIQHHTSPVRLLIKGFEHVHGLTGLARHLKKLKPDVIHFQWLPVPLIDDLFLPRFQKIAPLVLTVHDTDPFQGSPTAGFQRWRAWHVLHHFDAWIVHTDFSKKELLRKTKIPSNQIFIIPLGIFEDYSRFSANDHPARDPATPPFNVLFFGLIKPYKGVDILIRSLSKLPDSLRKNLRVLIAGQPRMNIEPLRSLARNLHVDHLITWDLRFIPDDEIPDIFHQADVVVLPYRRVDQSGILMTALAFQKPVIMTRIGGFHELIRDTNAGLTVNPNDPEDLARALTTLLTDQALRDRLTRAIQNLTTGRLSWKTIAEQTLRVYHFATRIHQNPSPG